MERVLLQVLLSLQVIRITTLGCVGVLLEVATNFDLLPDGLLGDSGITQRAQYPLIKEYSLKPCIVYALFLD